MSDNIAPQIKCFAGEDKEGGQFIPMKDFTAGMIGEGFYLDLSWKCHAF